MEAITSLLSTTDVRVSVPGRHVVVTFINRYLNAEHAVSVSKEWAESGSCSWTGYIMYPLPNDVCTGWSSRGRTVSSWDVRVCKTGGRVRGLEAACGRGQVGGHPRGQVHGGGDNPVRPDALSSGRGHGRGVQAEHTSVHEEPHDGHWRYDQADGRDHLQV